MVVVVGMVVVVTVIGVFAGVGLIVVVMLPIIAEFVLKVLYTMPFEEALRVCEKNKNSPTNNKFLKNLFGTFY